MMVWVEEPTVKAFCALCISHKGVWFFEIAQVQWMIEGSLTQGKEHMFVSYGGALRAYVSQHPAVENPGSRREPGSLGVLALC